MRSGFRGITGSRINFCRVLCEITESTTGKDIIYGWYALSGQKKDIIQFQDGSAYEIICEIKDEITFQAIDQDDLRRVQKQLIVHPLSVLISKFRLAKEYRAARDMYKHHQREERRQLEAEKRRLGKQDGIESVLRKIEEADSGDTIFPVKGVRNIKALIELGYVPGICDNPELWVDAEEFASLYYSNLKNGEELLLIGREKLQAVTDQDRIEYKFVVTKNKDKPKDFSEIISRFNRKRPGDPPRNWEEEFFKGLEVLTTYPEELKNKTVADLEVMTQVIDGVIVERIQIEEGLLHVDSLYKKETRKILVEVLVNGQPHSEIRKTLDYFEYTGIVQPAYKDSLFELIKMKAAGIALYDLLAKIDKEKTLDFVRTIPRRDTFDIRKIFEGTEIKEVSENQAFKDYIYTLGAIGTSHIHKKRVKVIVAMILKNIKGEINAKNITVAMLPYIEELGLDELDRIRQRILVLKDLVATQQKQHNYGTR
jgi:hypothetical protein